jgi:hypothetical protein
MDFSMANRTTVKALLQRPSARHQSLSSGVTGNNIGIIESA